MDNCPSDATETVLTFLRDVRVRITTWAPYATQIFQQLDITLFVVIKRREHYELPFAHDQGTADFLFKVYRTSKQRSRRTYGGLFRQLNLILALSCIEFFFMKEN
jgi:hypothetical protein